MSQFGPALYDGMNKVILDLAREAQADGTPMIFFFEDILNAAAATLVNTYTNAIGGSASPEQIQGLLAQFNSKANEFYRRTAHGLKH